MRFLFSVLLLLPAISVAAQVPAASTNTAVSIEELQGSKIFVSWSFAMRLRDRDGELPGGRKSDIRITIGPGKAIHAVTTISAWKDFPKGRKYANTRRENRGEIGIPTKELTGTMDVAWIFQDSTLTRLGAFATGGQILKITFKKDTSGLSCSTDIALAKEIGAGNLRDRGAVGSMVQVLSHKLIGTPTCRIEKPRT